MGGIVAAGAVLAACTSNAPDTPDAQNKGQAGPRRRQRRSRHEVTIGFSGPQGDHGWIAAISKNAEAQAKIPGCEV